MPTASRFFKKLAVLAAIETVYGTDIVPTAATNAMLVANVTLTPLTGDKVSRDVIRPVFGDQGFVIAGAYAKIEMETELAGSGAAGTVPGYGVLLRACGFSETVTADSSVVYQPITDQPESVSIYANLDGVNHIMVGARGTLSLNMDTKSIPKLKFTMTGLIGPVADVARPTVDLTAFQAPLVPSKLHTPTFSLFGLAASVAAGESLMIDIGNQVEPRMLIGSETIEITDRKASGTIVIAAKSIATKDWYGIALAGTKGALSVVHGTTAGNIVEIAAPAVQVGEPTYGNSQGVLTNSLPMTLTPVDGDDEIVLTVR